MIRPWNRHLPQTWTSGCSFVVSSSRCLARCFVWVKKTWSCCWKCCATGCNRQMNLLMMSQVHLPPPVPKQLTWKAIPGLRAGCTPRWCACIFLWNRTCSAPYVILHAPAYSTGTSCRQTNSSAQCPTIWSSPWFLKLLPKRTSPSTSRRNLTFQYL